MSNFVKAYQDDVIEFERVFGGTIKEVKSSLAVEFNNAAGETGFRYMISERARVGTQSTVRGHFNPSFLEGLREAKIIQNAVAQQPTPA